MRLYEFGPTRSIRVRWVLQELGIDFDSTIVNLPRGDHRLPEFLKINPAGKIPVLVDGDLVLNESAAIAWYLAENYGGGRLVPSDARGRAQALRWTFFAVTELEQPLWRITKHTRLYPEEKRVPAEAELAREDFGPMAAVLDDHLRGRDFIVGDALSVTDLVTAYTLDWANETHLLRDFPKLVDYLERIYRRPRAPARIAAEFARLAGA